jgi:signal transduction histidine kinase
VETTALILTAVVVANFLLGLFVLFRNPLSRQGQLFFIMVTFINCWAVTNYLTDNATKLAVNRYSNNLAYPFAFLAIASAVAFVGYFSGRIKRWSTRRKGILIVAAVLVSLFSYSHLIAGSVTQSHGLLHFSQGQFVIAYDVIIFSLLIYIVSELFMMRRRGTASQRNQANIIAWGFGISIVIGFLSNAIIPFFVDSFDSAKYGPPILSLLVVLTTTYAMIKHKLFDIRQFVVRAVAYILTLALITLLYVIPSLLLANHVLGAHLNLSTLFFLGAIVLLTAVLFQNLKTYFNKLTAKIFYRDYYEPQDVVDSISNLLAGTVNLDEIKEKTQKILATSLRPSHTNFLLLADIHEMSELDTQIINALSHHDSQLIVLDELNAQREPKLHQLLGDSGTALAISLHTKKEHLGYMNLGFKQSGSPYSETDMKLLGIIADEIAVGLQNALRFREIQKFNLTLQEKVEEATKELRRANTKLKELDKTKDEFISMASHQLRTPLTTIKGYLSMVLEGDAGPIKPKQREMIEQSFESASRMVYLIADLLNVSRLQSGKFVIINKPCNLADVVEGEVKQLAEQAKSRKITMTYDKPKEFPALNLDEDKVRQVVMNLLDNALYYTPSDGAVTVMLAATPDSVSYTVTDTGVGVPKAIQPHLFTKFYRADNARKMRPDGTGLGLYMAKKVITAQGGAIIFKSEEGKGSTFGFTFPRKRMEVKQ